MDDHDLEDDRLHEEKRALILDRERLDWMCDSYSAAGMSSAEAMRETEAYEREYAAQKRYRVPDRIAVRAAIDAAIASRSNASREPVGKEDEKHE